MNKKTYKIIIAIVLVIVLAFGAYQLIGPSSALVVDVTDKDGNKIMATDFTMEDIDGNKVNLRDYIGKPIVMTYWASWCPNCRRHMPNFQTAYNTYGNDVQFIMLNVTDGRSETKEDGTNYIGKNQYEMPFFFDTEMEGSIAYGVNSIPMTIFIDSEGYLSSVAQGPLDYEALESTIQGLK